MNRSIVQALVKKDMNDIIRSKSLFATLIVIPIIFCIVVPGLVVGSALFIDVEQLVGNDARKLVDTFLTKFDVGKLLLEDTSHQFIYIFINFLLPSLFLLVPIITSSVLAANSFVGEKERRTLESLLFSPITIKELFIGKVLAAFIPSFLVSIISFILSGIIINSLGYSLFDRLIFPSGNWIAMILLLSPMVMVMTILLNVLISSRVKTFQEAQNIGGIIVLPVIGMLVGQISGLFLIGLQLILIISFVILIMNCILLQRIMKHNDRYVLFEKQIN